MQLVGAEAKDQNLVVRIRGKGTAKPVLFLAHLDVVDAMRSDWSMEPYPLTEKDGWHYGRGTADDKGPAATLIAARRWRWFVRAPPDRDIILALTSGEENADEPGAAWLMRNAQGAGQRRVGLQFRRRRPGDRSGQAALDRVAGFREGLLERDVRRAEPGGHSSLPRADNAIYQLVNALAHGGVFFPIDLTEIARAQLAARRRSWRRDEAQMIREVLKGPLDSSRRIARRAFARVQLAAAHHLHPDDAGGGPRRERASGAGNGHGQLPADSRREIGRHSRGCSRRGGRHRQ